MFILDNQIIMFKYYNSFKYSLTKSAAFSLMS
jgi:hypothetical protein